MINNRLPTKRQRKPIRICIHQIMMVGLYNNQQKKIFMERTDDNNLTRRTGSRIWQGLVLVGAGFLLLAYKMGAPIPYWIFTWPMILITIGFFIGVQSRFQNVGAFILIAIGGIFLADKLIPEWISGITLFQSFFDRARPDIYFEAKTRQQL